METKKEEPNIITRWREVHRDGELSTNVQAALAHIDALTADNEKLRADRDVSAALWKQCGEILGDIDKGRNIDDVIAAARAVVRERDHFRARCNAHEFGMTARASRPTVAEMVGRLTDDETDVCVRVWMGPDFERGNDHVMAGYRREMRAALLAFASIVDGEETREAKKPDDVQVVFDGALHTYATAFGAVVSKSLDEQTGLLREIRDAVRAPKLPAVTSGYIQMTGAKPIQAQPVRDYLVETIAHGVPPAPAAQPETWTPEQVAEFNEWDRRKPAAQPEVPPMPEEPEQIRSWRLSTKASPGAWPKTEDTLRYIDALKARTFPASADGGGK